MVAAAASVLLPLLVCGDRHPQRPPCRGGLHARRDAIAAAEGAPPPLMPRWLLRPLELLLAAAGAV